MVAFKFFAIATSVLLALPSALAEPITPPPHLSLFSRSFSHWDPAIIPHQCKHKCKSFIDSLSCCIKHDCLNLNCVCSHKVVKCAKECLECLCDEKVPGFTNVDSAIDEFKHTCSAIGHPISHWDDKD